MVDRDTHRPLEVRRRRIAGQANDDRSNADHAQLRMVNVVLAAIVHDESDRLERLFPEILANAVGCHRPPLLGRP